VEIANGRADIAGPSDFMLPTGTRLVILGLKVDRDAIRLFTHTVRPVATADGKPAYGCTEFVFRVDPDVVQGSDPAPAQRAIEQWLTAA